MTHLSEVRGPFIEFARPQMEPGMLASDFCEKLAKMINEFDKELDQEHQVAVRLVSFGQAVTFHVTHLGYCNPSLISFYGRMENGSFVELIQHVSQISFLLMAVKRINAEEPKKPIGFISRENE